MNDAAKIAGDVLGPLAAVAVTAMRAYIEAGGDVDDLIDELEAGETRRAKRTVLRDPEVRQAIKDARERQQSNPDEVDTE